MYTYRHLDRELRFKTRARDQDHVRHMNVLRKCEALLGPCPMHIVLLTTIARYAYTVGSQSEIGIGHFRRQQL